jgi:hypothetical protein
MPFPKARRCGTRAGGLFTAAGQRGYHTRGYSCHWAEGSTITQMGQFTAIGQREASSPKEPGHEAAAEKKNHCASPGKNLSQKGKFHLDHGSAITWSDCG